MLPDARHRAPSRRHPLTERALTTDEGDDSYSLLVGRRALRRRFHVDPERSFVGGGTTASPPAG